MPFLWIMLAAGVFAMTWFWETDQMVLCALAWLFTSAVGMGIKSWKEWVVRIDQDENSNHLYRKEY